MPFVYTVSNIGGYADDGTTYGSDRNGRRARSGQLISQADRLNHTATWSCRVLFSQTLARGGATPIDHSPTVTTDPLHRLRYFARNLNAGRLAYGIVWVPEPTPVNTTRAILRDGATQVHTHEDFDTAIAVPGDLKAAYGILDYTPSGSATDRTIAVLDGYRLVSITVWELPDDIVMTPWGSRAQLTGTDHHVNWGLFSGAAPVLDQGIIDLRETQDEIWKRIRRVHVAWSTNDFADPGGAIVVSGTTTLTNLFDSSETARTTTSAGMPCQELQAGKQGKAYVEATVSAYARVTAGAGTVRFISSVNSADVSVGTVAGWSNGATKLRISTAATVEAGRDWDKVDILAAPDNAANAIRVWALRVEVDPD